MCVCVHDRGTEYIDRDREGGLYVCVSLLACVYDRQQATERVGMCIWLHLSLCLHVSLVCVLKTIRTSSHFDKAERHNP